MLNATVRHGVSFHKKKSDDFLSLILSQKRSCNCLQVDEIKIKRQYKSVNVTKNHNLFFCCAKRTHLWCSNFAPIKWDATADIRGTQGGLLTVTGQSGQAWTTTPFRQFQKVRCRKISLNPLCLAAKVLDLKLMWNSKL